MFGFTSLQRPLRARPVPAGVVLRQPAEPAPPQTPDEDAGRPSWLESSLDLREGLEVTEFATLGAVATDLPLSWWLH